MNKYAYELGQKVAAEDPFDVDRAMQLLSQDARIDATSKIRENNPGHYLANPYVPGPLSEGLQRLGRVQNTAWGSHPALMAASMLGPIAGGVAGYYGTPESMLSNDERRRNMGKGIAAGSLLPLLSTLSLGQSEYQRTVMRERGQRVLKEVAKKYPKQAAEKKDKKEDNKDSKNKSNKMGPHDRYMDASLKGKDYQIAGNVYNKNESPLSYLMNPFVQGILNEYMGNRLMRRIETATAQHPFAMHGGGMFSPQLAMTGGVIAGDDKMRKTFRDSLKGKE